MCRPHCRRTHRGRERLLCADVRPFHEGRWPAAGLDVVLVAVELAPESAPPSRRVSVEHVHNFLARLQRPAPAGQRRQALQASTPPLADTASYDTLRAAAQEADHA